MEGSTNVSITELSKPCEGWGSDYPCKNGFILFAGEPYPVASPAYGVYNAMCDLCEMGQVHYRAFTETPENRQKLKDYKLSQVLNMLHKAGIDETFRLKSLKDIPEGNNKRIIERYITKFLELAKNGWGFYFQGDVGRGKTHTTAALCSELYLRYDIVPTFVNSVSIANQFRNFENTKINYFEIVEKLSNAELLILDDLGAERATDWVKEQFYEIINTRYMKKKPMFITSNKSITDLQSSMPQIASRLIERCAVLMFAGPDYRHQLKPFF